MSLDLALREAGCRWDERLDIARRDGRAPSLPRDGWIAAVDPYRTGAWTRRLAWGGFDATADARTVMSEEEPPWVATLAWMRLVATRAASAPLQAPGADLPFAHIFHPLVEEAWVRASCADLCAISDSAGASLRQALLNRLCGLAAQPLAGLFCGERTLADVALKHIVDGTSPGLRTDGYERFCRQVLGGGLELLLSEFPVLGRLLATALIQWEEFCREFMSRLAVDRDAIGNTFGIPPTAHVMSLVLGLSDPHQEGRGVVVVGFGKHGQIVYKPRPTAIEQHYHGFVETVSALLPSDPLRRLTVLSRPAYGYVEYLKPEPVESGVDSDRLSRFYRNAGRTLAILYLLGATDCHWENMVAAHDQIVLVDAETLFEGKPRPWDQEQSEGPRSVVEGSIAESVLRTGMLPAWISIGAGGSIDISALGTPGPDRLRPPRPAWCFTNTDDMVWGDKEGVVVHPACLPVGEGASNPLAEFGEPLVEGFDEVLALAMEPAVRARLRDGLESFRGVKRRIVARPTRTYVLVQADALTPDSLRTADARALQLERLARAFTGGVEKPRAWRILNQEIAAMESLDVPYFEGVVGARGLFARGHEIVADYYETEGLAQALLRLDRISDSERRWQARLIHGSLAAHRFEMRPSGGMPTAEHGAQGARGHEAGDIADLIRADALDGPSGRPTWLTVALLADATRVQLGLVPPGLYDGRAGIAAFLYDNGDVDLAEAVIAPVLETLDKADELDLARYARGIGLGMAGVGGILRLFQYRAATDLDPEIWLTRSRRLLPVLTDGMLAADTASDLVSGIAGLAAPIARLHRGTPTHDSGRALAAVGRLLLQKQGPEGGWAIGIGHPPLAGLSHGASGVAVALAEIAVASGDDRYADAAARAVEFERGQFDEEAGNWRDLRRSPVEYDRLSMRSWCHGAVGIALARIRMLELLRSHPQAGLWAEDLRVAVEGSIALPLGPVDHICCGNIGRAIVIMLAGQFSDNADWQVAASGIGESVVALAGDDPDNYRLLLGIDGSFGLRLPGLMTGLAGIGMHLLHGQDLRWVRHLLV